MTRAFDEAVAAFERGDLERARALAEEQLAASNDSARVEHLLGVIDCRSGRIESGVNWLKRAVEKAPTNISCRVMLARALLDSGKPSEALKVAQPPAGATAPELALWHARAEAATKVAAWAEAAEAWGKLCSAGLGDWRAWSNWGDALGAIGRWGEAARALEQSVNLAPSDLGVRRNLAGALNNAGRFEESVEEFRRCISIAPRDKSLRISLAAILADLGRDEESQVELKKAVELAGETQVRQDGAGLIRIVLDASGAVDVASLGELAHMLERTSRTDALERLIEDAGTLGVSPERIGYSAAAAAFRRGNPSEAKRILLAENPDLSPEQWYWLLARIEDALGNPDEAFAAAETMNRSAENYEQWRLLGAEKLRSVERLAEAMTPQWASSLPMLKNVARATPAFIVGFPRSGTTLLDMFLSGHPGTKVLEEIPLIHAIDRTLGNILDLPTRSSTQLEQARNAYLAELDRHVDASFPGLAVDKLPLNMLAVPLLHCVFPQARLLFAQRHPCDVVLSCFMQAFVLNDAMACFLDIGDAAHFYDSSMRLWTKCTEVLPIKVHKVVYEDLVGDPEGTLRPAIEFLGLEWQPELLDHRPTAMARGRINTPSYNQVTQPLTRSASGRWKRYEKQLEPVLPILLPWAERLGYS